MNYYAKKRRPKASLQIFIIIILYLCCVLKIFTVKHEPQQFFINILLPYLNTTNIIFKSITAILLLFNAISVVLFLRRHSLIGLRNYYPALLYLLFSFIFANNINFWGEIIIVVILWVILPFLLNLNEESIIPDTFMYGLCCGILSLLYIPFILLLILLYIVALYKKIYIFRAFILPVIGLCIVYIYIYVGFYLLDKFEMIQSFSTVTEQQTDINIFFISYWKKPISLIVSILLGGYSFFKIFQQSGKTVINRRRSQYILLIVIVFQFVITFLFNANYNLFGHVMIVLLAILLSLSMLYTNKKIVYKMIFFLLFIMAVYANFLI